MLRAVSIEYFFGEINDRMSTLKSTYLLFVSQILKRNVMETSVCCPEGFIISFWRKRSGTH